jgi:hypothetical protein
MRIAKENWKVLASLFPAGWQQMAWQSGAVERLRGFPSPDVLLRILMLHVARGYSLRETVVRATPANWTDISDVALLIMEQEEGEFLRHGPPGVHANLGQVFISNYSQRSAATGSMRIARRAGM